MDSFGGFLNSWMRHMLRRTSDQCSVSNLFRTRTLPRASTASSISSWPVGYSLGGKIDTGEYNPSKNHWPSIVGCANFPWRAVVHDALSFDFLPRRSITFEPARPFCFTPLPRGPQRAYSISTSLSNNRGVEQLAPSLWQQPDHDGQSLPLPSPCCVRQPVPEGLPLNIDSSLP